MSKTAEAILDEVLKLDSDERTSLIVRLLDTLGAEEDPTIEAQWRVEVRKRIADIESGKRTLSNWDEAHHRIFAR